jgi:hypothetical protein
VNHGWLAVLPGVPGAGVELLLDGALGSGVSSGGGAGLA